MKVNSLHLKTLQEVGIFCKRNPSDNHENCSVDFSEKDETCKRMNFFSKFLLCLEKKIQMAEECLFYE